MTPSEIEAIGADARRRAHDAVFLLVTHADYDHVYGIPYFPEAEVSAGAETAQMLRDGSAAAGLVSGGAEWGVEWPAGLRVDRQLTAGAELLGALERYSLRHVVPGHRPVLPPDEAKRIGHEDLRYLERLGLAAREAADADLSPGYALVHV